MKTPKKRLLVIDNFDSFTFNLAQMFLSMGVETIVRRNNELSPIDADLLDPTHILISPGPGTPDDSGFSREMIMHFHERIPVLGVCLGMQCLSECFGGETVRAPIPVHGKTSLVFHNQEGIFKNMPSPFRAARYHSLAVRPFSADIKVTAETEDRVIMGIAHKNLPLFGVQFHPESFMTESGHILAENFMGYS